MSRLSRLCTVEDFSELNYGFGIENNLFVFHKMLVYRKNIYWCVFYTVLTSAQQNTCKRMV